MLTSSSRASIVYRKAFTILVIAAFMVTISAVLAYSSQDFKYQRLAPQTIINPIKVFQIGFSKCGTATIADFFNLNGIPAVHQDDGHLAVSMYRNAQNRSPLITQQYDKFLVYTDMERMGTIPQINIGVLLFKELDRQYPGSKFILNTRNKNAWLKSKSLHHLGTDTTLLERTASLLNISPSEVLAKWSREWDEHHAAVLEYFQDRPEDLLVFNIESDDPKKLVEFFKHNFLLDTKFYGHKNKTIPDHA